MTDAADAQSAPTPVPLKPGWKTTEAWITLLVVILGGLLSSGVVGDISPVGKDIVFGLTVLKALGYTGARAMLKNGAAASMLVLVALHAAGCGASARQKTISTAMTATNAASAAFVAFDAHHQQDLVDQAKDKPSGEAELATWRTKQVEVEKWIAAAYKAIAVAAQLDDDQSLRSMILAVAQLSAELKTLGVMP